MNKLWIPLAGVSVLGLVWLALSTKLPHHSADSALAKYDSANASAPSLSPAIAKSSRESETRDPRTALNAACGLASFDVRDQSTRHLLETWTQQAPAEAIAWASALSDAGKRQAALEIVCLDLAQSDPRRAVDTAIDTQVCDTDPGLLSNLTAQWAMRDLGAAHDWVRQQEAGDWRDELVARVAFAGAQSDPAAAAQIVVTEMAPGPRQEEAAISVLHQWALSDLGAATTWASAFPAGSLHTRALAEIEGIRKSRQTVTQP
jgi:hypothetical protein